MRRARSAITMVLAMILLYIAMACSTATAMPSFARPSSVDGFRELGSGQASDKEEYAFWVFGGDVPFASWKQRAVRSLVEHGWNTTPEDASPQSKSSFIGFSPNRELCLSYYDLKADDGITQHFVQMVGQIAPGSLNDASQWQSIILVAAGKCA